MWSLANPKDVCVDEMVNLTFTPFARTIQRIKKSACQSFSNLCLSVVKLLCFPTTYCVMYINVYNITCIDIYIYLLAFEYLVLCIRVYVKQTKV